MKVSPSGFELAARIEAVRKIARNHQAIVKVSLDIY